MTFDCEHIMLIADEYFHGELTQDEADCVDTHLLKCVDCKTFYDQEKKMIDVIKASEYVPERSLAAAVMEKIIDEKIIIQKLPKKRPIPFGLISAAVIVLIMFAVNRTVFNITDKAAGENNSQADVSTGDSAHVNELSEPDQAAAPEIRAYYATIEEVPDDTNGILERKEAYVSDDVISHTEGGETLTGEAEPFLSITPYGFGSDSSVLIIPESESATGLTEEPPVSEEISDTDDIDGDYQIPVARLICAGIDDAARDKLISSIGEEINTAEVEVETGGDSDDILRVYIAEEYYEKVKDIVIQSGIEYQEYGEHEAAPKANDMAILFY